MKLCAIFAVVATVRVNGSECDAAPAEVDDEVTLLSIRASVSQRAATKQAMQEKEEGGGGARLSCRRRRCPAVEPEDEEIPADLQAWASSFLPIIDKDRDQPGFPHLVALENGGWEEVLAIEDQLDAILAHSERGCDPERENLQMCEHTPCLDLFKGKDKQWNPSRHHLMWLNPDKTAQIVTSHVNDHDIRERTCTRDSEAFEFSLVGTWNCPNFYADVITITSTYADDFTDARTNERIKVCSLGPPVERNSLVSFNNGHHAWSHSPRIADLRSFETQSWAIVTALEHKIDDLSELLGGVRKPAIPRVHHFHDRGNSNRKMIAGDLIDLQSEGVTTLEALCAKLFELAALASFELSEVCGLE